MANTGNAQVNIAWDAGSTVKAVTDASLASTLNWFQIGLTVDKTGDKVIAYINGAQVGSTQTGLGTWAGALAATLCNIGAAATTPTAVWSGLIAHVVIASRAALAGEMALGVQILGEHGDRALCARTVVHLDATKPVGDRVVYHVTPAEVIAAIVQAERDE